MKKIFMLLIALVAYCGGAMADGLEVQDVNISQGGEATLEIALENPVWNWQKASLSPPMTRESSCMKRESVLTKSSR